MAGWGDFESRAPALAAFGADRLGAAAAYLATTRSNGTPRVHPVAPIVGGGRLFVFMEPTSPKVHDFRERRSYALHNGVPDTYGTGGEFYVRGVATPLEDPELRAGGPPDQIGLEPGACTRPCVRLLATVARTDTRGRFVQTPGRPAIQLLAIAFTTVEV